MGAGMQSVCRLSSGSGGRGLSLLVLLVASSLVVMRSLLLLSLSGWLSLRTIWAAMSHPPPWLMWVLAWSLSSLQNLSFNKHFIFKRQDTSTAHFVCPSLCMSD